MDSVQMHTTIKRAIFPVAGLGTRFLPATKANPKEMLPIVDKPLIQYAVEEAIAAGITELIFVTSSSKRAIEDHFDSNFELETTLAERGQRTLLELVRNILPEGVSCAYVRQQAPRGLGHAILCAKSLVMNEPFAVLLADDLIDGRGISCLQQMVNQFAVLAAPVVAVQRVKKADVGKYGIITGEPVAETHLTQLTGIVEKPLPQDAPSEWGVVGRYILTPAIFDYLESVPAAAQQEIQLTDAIAGLLSDTPVYAYAFRGKRYDCGTKLGYLEATMAYALQHPELAEPFKDMLSGLLVT
jgi:UTP--glucose-1-phosphate uridylyltransferase